ncbi:hypothetical protein [Mycolicibacterium brumae]|uniref:Uncharacterized protein n=1 Tax=Mycolicibacterium brumae TaxID=85968 RepID=A0A2G5P9Z2_9MYCO|nr:hypothetical protein [Mycolicibacterium brumae]MCV7192988.1 hypothetical protein [Mycolicibacterium brumae]PIB75181.1 hypothetical protein CQY22_009930 [Mycolicibacterium brumae]RWA23578.1 hypothetical protein MBRU_01760 [Mycolicibacterium brumae DSM 44177]UWW08493.1 hypothetical protein L2Z93_001554 [Mycolicibacterium brumae]
MDIDLAEIAAPRPAEELVDEAAQLLAAACPTGWQHMRAAFSMAGGQQIARGVATTAAGPVGVAVPARVVDLAQQHRGATIGVTGPWFRMLIDLGASGELAVSFDYGDNPIPADELLPSEAYLRDLEQHPRPDVALWLLAYAGNEGQQRRSPAQARQSALAAPRVADGLPVFDLLWSRMAALAALCRGVDHPEGVRLDPAFAVFRSGQDGCTVAKLPGGRAVISGGRGDSALLTAAYRGQTGWPDLYRGAPAWVYDLYLDPRAAAGLLSFCCWWDGHTWYSAERGTADERHGAVPAVWSIESTAEAVTGVLNTVGVALTDRNAYAAANFVRAADAGIVTEATLRQLFVDGVPESFDMAAALAQLDAADVLLPLCRRIPEDVAIRQVIDYCRSGAPGSAGYPLNRLAAVRLEAGWQVFAPVPPGEWATGRTVFLVADDGVVEPTTMAGGPTEVAMAFAARFARRVRNRAERR